MRCVIAILFGSVVSMQASQLVTLAQFGGLQATGTISASMPTGVYFQDANHLLSGGANAVSGYLSKGTAVGLLSQNSAPFGFGPAPGEGLAGSWDVVTPGVSAPFSSGFMVLDFLVSGTNSATILGDPRLGGDIGNTRMDTYTKLYICLEDPFQGFYRQACSIGTYDATFGGASYSSLPIEFKLPVLFGQPRGLEITQFSSIAGAFDPNRIITYTGSSDFYHTSILSGVHFLDPDGNPIGGTLTSQSGTIYPVDAAAAPSPEPSSFVLLVIGGFTMYRLSKSRFRIAGSTMRLFEQTNTTTAPHMTYKSMERLHEASLRET